MINKDVISKLNPCKDRFDNYIKFYSSKTHTKAQFLGLKNITHSDKVWVAVRLLSNNKLRFFLADIAELVLPIFEAKYPNDLRPRLAIEAARSKTMTANAICDAAHAAHAAARDAHAASVASYYAASCAGHAAYAAAYAAYAAYDAHAGFYAAFDAFDAAAYAAYSAAYGAPVASYDAFDADSAVYAVYTDDKKSIEKKIRTLILKYWKE